MPQRRARTDLRKTAAAESGVAVTSASVWARAVAGTAAAPRRRPPRRAKTWSRPGTGRPRRGFGEREGWGGVGPGRVPFPERNHMGWRGWGDDDDEGHLRGGARPDPFRGCGRWSDHGVEVDVPRRRPGFGPNRTCAAVARRHRGTDTAVEANRYALSRAIRSQIAEAVTGPVPLRGCGSSPVGVSRPGWPPPDRPGWPGAPARRRRGPSRPGGPRRRRRRAGARRSRCRRAGRR